jgi:hypothetical protein
MNNSIHNISRKLVYKFIKHIFECKRIIDINVSFYYFVNIEYKLYALRLNHIQDIIVNRNVKFINFSVYWIGYQLRDLNFNSFHSTILITCLSLFNNKLHRVFVLYCPNTISLHLFLKIFSTFKYLP